MKKVFIVHGFEGAPNGGWRPWLMQELDALEVYACALGMPNSYEPLCKDWVEEIRRHVEGNAKDEIYLVGHSLGVPAILRYLESAPRPIAGAVLISGPARRNNNQKIDSFLKTPFDFAAIKPRLGTATIIHGDDDPLVPLEDARILEQELGGTLVVVPGGKHLNASAGWNTLPQALEALKEMM